MSLQGLQSDFFTLLALSSQNSCLFFSLDYITRQVMTSPGGSIRPRQEKGGGQEELEAI